jgi:hypothetical protein
MRKLILLACLALVTTGCLTKCEKEYFKQLKTKAEAGICIESADAMSLVTNKCGKNGNINGGPEGVFRLLVETFGPLPDCAPGATKYAAGKAAETAPTSPETTQKMVQLETHVSPTARPSATAPSPDEWGRLKYDDSAGNHWKCSCQKQ